MVNNEPSLDRRRRMAGIPPVLMNTSVAEPKAQEPTGVSLAQEQTPEAPLDQSLRQRNGRRLEEPNAQTQTQPRAKRRRMVGPSVVPLEAEAAPVAGKSDGPDMGGTQIPLEPSPAVGPASASPAARRRMGAPPTAAASAAPAEPHRMATFKPADAPADRRETPVEAPVPQTPAADTRPAATTEQEPAAPSVKNQAPKRRALSAVQPQAVRGVLIVAGVVLVFLALVLLARWLRAQPGVAAFLADYSGHASQPAAAPEGIPGWLGWQHFLNMFFMVLIVRSGLQVRWERRPPGYWTPKKGSFFSPGRKTPKKISLSQWLHQFLDVLWVANGFVFIVMLIVSGHWMRIVPTSWDVFPHMLAAGLQYASLDWPAENGWVHYNALQVMAYFVTVMIAAPLAILSGIRLSTWWPTDNQKLSRLYPVEIARAVHVPVMVYFVVFTIVHVFLVFFTGALRNLNHMYTARDVVDFWGLVVFLVSLGIVAVGWFLTSQMFVRPAAGRMGKVTKN